MHIYMARPAGRNKQGVLGLAMISYNIYSSILILVHSGNLLTSHLCMVEGRMGHQEVNHRSDPVFGSGHPHIQQEPIVPQLLHTSQRDHAQASIQPRSKVPSQNPHAIPFDSIQHMQNPLNETQFMPQHQQQANVVYYSPPPVPAHYPGPTTNFQPSPAGMQYLPVNFQPTLPPVNMVQPPPRVNTAGWTTGLFDCMDDPTNALITICVPCLTFGQIAEIVDNGHTSCGTSGLIYGAIACLIGCPFLISCTYRTKLRSRYDLVESPAPDWLVHLLCDCCALCQEYRELRNRGFDPSIGWHANVRLMQQQQVAMVAPPNQAMMGR